MIRYTVIIKNRKNEVLICGDEDLHYEFPGVLLFNKMPFETDMEYFIRLYIKNVIGISVDNLKHFETFYYFPKNFKSIYSKNVH